jgi:hypothetical protein
VLALLAVLRAIQAQYGSSLTPQQTRVMVAQLIQFQAAQRAQMEQLRAAVRLIKNGSRFFSRISWKTNPCFLSRQARDTHRTIPRKLKVLLEMVCFVFSQGMTQARWEQMSNDQRRAFQMQHAAGGGGGGGDALGA